MKRWEKILLGTALVGIAGIVSVGIWQKDNIEAGVMFLTKSTDELASNMDTTKKQLEDELRQQYPNVVSDFTAEEERMIMKGELTVEEAVEIMKRRYEEAKTGINNSDDSQTPQSVDGEDSKTTSGEKSEKSESSDGKTGGNSKTGSGKNTEGKTATDSKSGSGGKTNSGGTATVGKSNSSGGAAESIVSDKVVQLYSLKAYYLGQLGQLEAQAKNKYKSMPKEQRKLVGKSAIVNEYIGIATGYMNACDAQVNSILSELEAELRSVNADTSVVGTIREAYESEKTMKKAYYMSLIN